MKPELTIHIGRPKVGSTAIQAFLNQNRAGLLKQGLCYPKTGLYHSASHHFSLVFLPGLPDHRVVRDIQPAELFAQLRAEFESSGASRALISSENFWLVKPAKLAAQVAEYFDVKIIAYLRRQDDVLMSSFIQEVRGGSQSLDQPMDDYLSDKSRLQLLDYDQVLASWEKSFGQENIEVRLYEAIDPEQGIERDFLQALDIDTEAGFIFGKTKKNASPAVDILKMLESIREFPVGELSHRQLSGILSEVSGQLGEAERYDSRRLISAAQRQRVIEHFAASNARLFERYDCGGARFPVQVPEETMDAAPVEVTLDRNHRALLGILSYQQRQIQILISRLNHLQGTAPGAAPLAPPRTTVRRGFLRRLLDRLGL